MVHGKPQERGADGGQVISDLSVKRVAGVRAQDWLRGGEMGKLIGSMDWSQTPLGPMESWPQSLRTTVSLVMASNFPISIAWGPKHVQIYNDGYWPICGAKHPQSMGQDFSECWASAWPVVGEAFDKALAGQGSYLENQRMFLDRNGYLEETFFTFSYSPICDETGGVGGVFAPVTETTTTMLSERRTRALRDLAAGTAEAKTIEGVFRLAAESLHVFTLDVPFLLFYLFDAQGNEPRLAAWNELVPGSIASSPDDWPLRDIAGSKGISEIRSLRAQFPGLVCGPYPESPDMAFGLPITLPGFDRPIGVVIAAVSPRLPLNEAYRAFFELLVAGLTSAATNAYAHETERRRAEALAEIDRAKSVFFSNVSHEFRTPLTLMLGPLEDVLANEVEPLHVHQREQVTMAHRNAFRLLKLVNTLLDFSRLEAGRIQATYHQLDLPRATSDLASLFRSAVERAGLVFIVQCDSFSTSVCVDSEMWEKIVLNLLSNALKFTFKGEIALTLHEDDGRAVLSVRDTGIGIGEDELPRVFERFHRVEGAHGRSEEGSGIGLALVQELVKLHGGEVRVESVLGQGSTFTVVIPLGTAHLPKERIGAARTQQSTAVGAAPFVEEAASWLSDVERFAPEAQEPSSALQSSNDNSATVDVPSRFRTARVLLADDNADLRAYVSGLLERYFIVQAVTNGAEALTAAREHKPDLILTDVMMPLLDGFGLLHAIRSDPDLRMTPVILLSARAGEESKVEGLEMGADDYLVKPFAARELLARVRTHLEMSEVRADIAGHKLRAEILRASEERLRLALEGGKMGTWEWDTDTGRAIWNAREYELLDLPVGDGNSTSDLFFCRIHPDDVSAVNESLTQALATRSDWAREFRIIRADGETRWLAGVARFVADASGDTSRMIGINYDITERRRTEETLRDADRRKNEFLAVLSHELRNPLAPIRSSLYILERATPGGDQARRAQAVIERQTAHLARLVDDLLDMTRISRGKIQLQIGLLDLDELVKRTVEDHHAEFVKGDVELTLVPASSKAWVKGDRTRIAQVIGNLLQNAAKFTPRGGKATISVQNDAPRGQVILRVQDTGSGITPEILLRMFEPFTQADVTLDRSNGGLGLGLALVKGLVDLHGGTVTGSSDGLGKGATFTVKLPLAAPPAIVEVARGNGNNGAVRRVLVIEDNRDAADMLCEALEICDNVVDVAYQGSEGLAKIRSLKPDIVICDIGLPGMDGFDIARAVRADPEVSRTLLVAMTGYAQAEDALKAREAGFDAHIAKPASIDTLLRVIGEVSKARNR